MKLVKKHIIFLLLTCLLCTYPSTILAAPQAFKDINNTEWYINDLNSLTKRNIISGFPDNTFRGNSLLKKDQLIKTLIVSFDYNVIASPNYWAQNYIDKAIEMNWLEGLKQDHYNNDIDRFDTCKLMINAIGNTEIYPSDLESYSIYIKDYETIPANYKQDVLKTYYLGLITGYPDGNFKGSNNLTRAEAVAIINRLINPNNRRKPLNPIDCEKLNNILFNNNVFDETSLSYENNTLNYYDGSTDEWQPIYNTDLDKNIARISEDTYVDIATYLDSNYATFPTLLLNTAYGYNNFYMYLEDNEIQLITYSADDRSNAVQITLPDLYEEPYGNINKTTDHILSIILENISDQNATLMYNYITSEIKLNSKSTPIIDMTTIDNYSITTTSLQGNFIVDITINN